MSFLTRTRSLITQLPRLASTFKPRRSICTRAALQTSGYGNNPPSQPQQPWERKQQQQSQQQNEQLQRDQQQDATKNARNIDRSIQDAENMREMSSSAIDGGRLPNYSGPSIAEKRNKRPLKPQNMEDEDMQKWDSRDFAKEEQKSDQMFKKLSDENQNLQGSERGGNVDQPIFGKQGVTGELPSQQQQRGGKMKKDIGQSRDSQFDQFKRSLWTSSFRLAPPLRRDDLSEVDRDRLSDSDSLKEDLKDDMHRLKDKASSGMERAKLKAKEVGLDIKESAKELAAKAKKGARHAKESIKEGLKEASTPVDDLYPTADSLQDKGGVRVPMSSPDVAAVQSGDVLGEDVNAVRKSFFEGPQDMPQGVGRRAKDEFGRPMETGTDRS